MLHYARTDIVRMLRNRRYIIFVVAFPVVIYLINAGIYGDQVASGGVTANVYLMVSMAAYGAMAAALVSTAMPWAQERQSGWLRQLQITPLPGWMIIVTKLAAAMTLVLPALTLVALAAILVRHVSLPPGQWIPLVLSLWLGAVPFVALGLTIGSLLPPEVAQPASMIGMFAFAILGGLWFPADVMGGAMRTIAHLMPSYHYAEMGWSITEGHGLPLGDALVVLGWAVALGLVATWSYRRATVRG
ncbi:ABC transporter permease [Nonomuraea sp. NPDC004354]